MRDEILNRNLRAMRGMTAIGEKVIEKAIGRRNERKAKNTQPMFEPATIAHAMANNDLELDLER